LLDAGESAAALPAGGQSGGWRFDVHVSLLRVIHDKPAG